MNILDFDLPNQRGYSFLLVGSFSLKYHCMSDTTAKDTKLRVWPAAIEG